VEVFRNFDRTLSKNHLRKLTCCKSSVYPTIRSAILSGSGKEGIDECRKIKKMAGLSILFFLFHKLTGNSE